MMKGARDGQRQAAERRSSHGTQATRTPPRAGNARGEKALCWGRQRYSAELGACTSSPSSASATGCRRASSRRRTRNRPRPHEPLLPTFYRRVRCRTPTCREQASSTQLPGVVGTRELARARIELTSLMNTGRRRTATMDRGGRSMGSVRSCGAAYCRIYRVHWALEKRSTIDCPKGRRPARCGRRRTCQRARR